MPALATSRRLVASGALALTLVLAASACGSDDSGNVVAEVEDDDSLPTQPDTPVTDTSEAAPQTCEAAPEEVTAEDAPVVEVPEGEPPTELQIEDLVVGEGREAAVGDTLQMQYTGVAFSTGTEFDSSWDDLTPLPVTLGTGSVIPGWEEGLIGMKPGGRRQLVIPPDQAYGEEGSPPDIGPNETLVFVVDAVEVCFPDPEAGTTTTVAGGDTTVPEGETTVPEGETTVPEGETTVPEGETTVPEGETTAPETTVPADGSTTTAGG